MFEAITTVFFLGLLSSLHCGGMCGGISGALSLSLPTQVRSHAGRLLGYQVLFNLGRIMSYALIGGIFGVLALAVPDQYLTQTLSLGRILVGFLLMLLALQFTGWIRPLAGLERMGMKLWRKLTPLYRPFLPIKSPFQAVMIGIFWGWLPCGLVYAALAYTLTVPGPYQSTLVMFAFGLGTLPALLTSGSAFALALRRLPATRPAMGVLLLLLGIWTIYAAWPLGHADHHAAHAVVPTSQYHAHP